MQGLHETWLSNGLGVEWTLRVLVELESRLGVVTRAPALKSPRRGIPGHPPGPMGILTFFLAKIALLREHMMIV